MYYCQVDSDMSLTEMSSSIFDQVVKKDVIINVLIYISLDTQRIDFKICKEKMSNANFCENVI